MANYAPLHRRRRISDQNSPSSPSYSRRLVDRSGRYSDALSPAEATSGTDESDSPSGKQPLSSPVHERFQALPSAPPPARSSVTDPRTFQRSSEETGRPRFRPSDEAVRPATSDAADPNNPSPDVASRPSHQSMEQPLRPSPMPYNSSPNTLREETPLDRSRYSENPSSPHFRNHSFSSPLADRFAHDEPISVKGHVGKKSRLNLLNPMSLLARRRSSQNQKLEDINLSINTLSVPALPADFDPSIRGKVVHDFSAPRARRLFSHNDISNIGSPRLRAGYGSDVNRSNDLPGNQNAASGTPNMSHSPMFKEHFQEDRPALQPERTGYLHNFNASSVAYAAQDPDSVPAFAKRLPAVVPQPESDIDAGSQDKENISFGSPSEDKSPLPPTPPPKSTPSPKLDLPPPAALPKHMTSTSSRFSFQLGETGSSAQEKLLEEKHKQYEATRHPTAGGGNGQEDEYADYDFDADDGFEEKIPGVNADYDEDDGFGEDIPPSNALVARYAAPEADFDPPPATHMTELQKQSLQSFHFTPQSLTFSPTSTNNGSQPTPRDHEGLAIGIANSRESFQHTHSDIEGKEETIDTSKVPTLGGLGISTAEVRGRRSSVTSRPYGQIFDDEDLYFDDGEFDVLDVDIPSGEFDEQIFDDGNGKIRDIPAENARKFEAARQSAGPYEDVKVMGQLDDEEAESQASESNSTQGTSRQAPPSSHEPTQLSQAEPANGSQVTGLTETNLAAYHDALAHAANQAAASGKFDRKVSFDQISDDTSQSALENSQPGVISDDGHFSYNFNPAVAEDDGFPFDDELEDDPMIAEANAEVLENDDEGFYGREFGFYARSHNKASTELVNGGYFAERGSNGIKRSHSGKANFQEPSLTPITERSEWSTRNSVVSLQLPGGMPASAHSLPSPGIAQLLELDSPSYDEDMSFSALYKLRGRAFGGSSTSINSSNAGHPVSSPLAHFSNHSFTQGDGGAGRIGSSIHGRAASPAGIPESEEEDDEAERLTLTQNTPRKKVIEPVTVMSHEEMPSTRAVGASGERRKGQHSRTSSGAESVSYAKDIDGRWVLERRRTDEGSGTEVIDREYLAGVRI
ncbi:hypothetical protein LTR10_012770 [Elasticomyces elasticus]|uniref:AGC-kinase C-terminal domain-containing protein n=1 Tax=Exophiala sideris TaxID=1016849 RepID=A0ABR0JR29_9EURO|nr:hypothetical protein LTR10_012770 [Elasticomyces elasticus]KAK5034647.1 hypothetical protein LTR13_006303 [Exophiala sideris]KAK5040031.1 hypothetical protein LTS07_000527 [Exophiala sideris]KAK5068409.1 hypothetical protein LTR69_000528 [Exophiala sideris]KAK5187711.1 hypothetical protein LTR44_000528 [Eurotiomycetes sp. CCFEE 6388]